MIGEEPDMSQPIEPERDDPEPDDEEEVEEEIEAEPEFNSLDPTAVRLWRFEGFISTGILSCVALGVVYSISRAVTVPLWVVFIIWAFLGSLLYFSAGWAPSRKYSAWSYRVSEKVLELRFGILWRRSVMIPLTRLQHVDLKSGPLERRFSVSSLSIHTAGTAQSSHEIPYLAREIGTALREQLIAAADLQAE